MGLGSTTRDTLSDTIHYHITYILLYLCIAGGVQTAYCFSFSQHSTCIRTEYILEYMKKLFKYHIHRHHQIELEAKSNMYMRYRIWTPMPWVEWIYIDNMKYFSIGKTNLIKSISSVIPMTPLFTEYFMSLDGGMIITLRWLKCRVSTAKKSFWNIIAGLHIIHPEGDDDHNT